MVTKSPGISGITPYELDFLGGTRGTKKICGAAGRSFHRGSARPRVRRPPRNPPKLARRSEFLRCHRKVPFTYRELRGNFA